MSSVLPPGGKKKKRRGGSCLRPLVATHIINKKVHDILGDHVSNTFIRDREVGVDERSYRFHLSLHARVALPKVVFLSILAMSHIEEIINGMLTCMHIQVSCTIHQNF